LQCNEIHLRLIRLLQIWQMAENIYDVEDTKGAGA